jgi:MoxR-like ATPase
MTEPAEGLEDVASLYGRLKTEADRVLMGQEQVFELLCVALLSGGHVLLEGVPGTAKTLMAKLLSRLVKAEFRRIQFTPDLMPSDIAGTTVFDLQSGAFHFRRGPVFTQILLADEINRAPAKTQAALLEAMEEHQVTVDGTRYVLDVPFMVIATQNPIEYEGTYPLPEAQLDRFLFKLAVPYPNPRAEEQVLRMYDQGFDAQKLDDAGIAPVLEPRQLEAAKSAIQAVTVDVSIFGYIVALSQASRTSEEVSLGASPRASIALLLASKTIAAMRGRDFVTPDDIKAIAPSVLRHRVMLRPEAEIEGLTADQLIARLLERVPVPR